MAAAAVPAPKSRAACPGQSRPNRSTEHRRPCTREVRQTATPPGRGNRSSAIANDGACSARAPDSEEPERPTERAHGKEAQSTVCKHTALSSSQCPKTPRTRTPGMKRSKLEARRRLRRTHPLPKRRVNRGAISPPRRVFDRLLPGRCSVRSWGSSTSRLFSPRESVPSRRGLDGDWADALLGFRLLRDFAPVVARNALTPSTLTGFSTNLTRRPCASLPLRA